jgi:hypothetical protein
MKKVRVVAVASFENVRKGDEAEVVLTPRLKGIIANGYLKVVGDGESSDRFSSNSSGDVGSSEAGADDRIPTGPEQSEDSDAS